MRERRVLSHPTAATDKAARSGNVVRDYALTAQNRLESSHVNVTAKVAALFAAQTIKPSGTGNIVGRETAVIQDHRDLEGVRPFS